MSSLPHNRLRPSPADLNMSPVRVISGTSPPLPANISALAWNSGAENYLFQSSVPAHLLAGGDLCTPIVALSRGSPRQPRNPIHFTKMSSASPKVFIQSSFTSACGEAEWEWKVPGPKEFKSCFRRRAAVCVWMRFIFTLGP